MNRPTTWEQTRGGGAWFARSHFQYDKVGREVAVWRGEDGNKGERFWFNVTNQIERAVYKAENVWTTTPSNGVLDQQYAYTPDMLNRTSLTENGVVTNYAAATDLNQYTNVGGVEVRYDGNFNLAYYGGATATYNAQNRLISINAGGTGGFVYDGLGRCVKRTINGVATQLVYDGWKPVTEYDGAGNLSARNIYGPGPDEILMRGSGYGWFFYHADKQGSVSALVDLNGNVVEKYSYDAFGKPAVTSWDYNTGSWKLPASHSSFGNRFLFTGREWIAELNIYDYRNRFYFPAIGRFLQTDPTGFEAGDMNLFRYCADDPVNMTDPDGTTAIDSWKYQMLWQGNGDGTVSEQMKALSDRAKPQAGMGDNAGGGEATSFAGKNEAKASPWRWQPGTPVRGGTYRERKEFRAAIKKVLGTKHGQKYGQEMKMRGYGVTTHLTDEGRAYADSAPSAHVRIDPNYHPLTLTTAGRIPATTTRLIAHEFGHAIMGTLDDGPQDLNNVRQNETPIMLELGEPERIKY